LTETIARLTGFESRIVWDTSKPNPSTVLRTVGQPRRKLDFSRARERFASSRARGLKKGYSRRLSGI
jgi:hypothetical protein